MSERRPFLNGDTRLAAAFSELVAEPPWRALLEADVLLRGAAAFRPRFTAAHVALGLVARRAPAVGARFRFRIERDDDDSDDDEDRELLEEIPS